MFNLKFLQIQWMKSVEYSRTTSTKEVAQFLTKKPTSPNFWRASASWPFKYQTLISDATFWFRSWRCFSILQGMSSSSQTNWWESSSATVAIIVFLGWVRPLDVVPSWVLGAVIHIIVSINMSSLVRPLKAYVRKFYKYKYCNVRAARKLHTKSHTYIIQGNVFWAQSIKRFFRRYHM